MKTVKGSGGQVLAYDCEHRASEKETTVSGFVGEALLQPDEAGAETKAANC